MSNKRGVSQGTLADFTRPACVFVAVYEAIQSTMIGSSVRDTVNLNVTVCVTPRNSVQGKLVKYPGLLKSFVS